MYRNKSVFVLAMAGLAAVLLFSPLHAQVAFERTYGGSNWEEGRTVVLAPGGGYAVAGFTGHPDGDVYLVKTDAYGDTVWTRIIGGGNHEIARMLHPTADSGYIIAGQTNSFGAGRSDMYLIKTDARGDTLWTRTFGHESIDIAYAVDECDDRGYIIAGQTRPVGTVEENVYVVRTDETGIPLWTRTYGGAGRDIAFSVTRTADRGFILCGAADSAPGGKYDLYVIRLNADGDTLWTRRYGGAGDELGRLVQQTPDGGFAISGYTTSFGAGGFDAWLVRMDANGDTLWTRTFGGESTDIGAEFAQTPDHGFAIVGHTSSFGMRYIDGWLIKTDSAGDTMWTRTYGGGDYDMLYSIKPTADKGYILAGTTSSFGAGLYDVYLVKTDSLGASSVALAEPTPGPPGLGAVGPTIVRGVLVLPGLGTRSELPERNRNCARRSTVMSRAALLDIAGRKVLEFKPGANDVRHLAPGVYFIAEGLGVRGQGLGRIRKVLVVN